ncbi:hypothetical protein ACHAWO_013792 [Cyclotella atomus]|uniref:Mediator complex subunit 15 KIX domain-containing protein n=1 Tax=Cyclotella atomus TaxID=382360 RepID=A0ABD3QXR1_9STRA
MSSEAAAAADSWRSSIAQSYRSTEVRSIATVLAELEPGATSASKTMLAMRFEESIFKAATSLDDYKKTIEKRLKKLRKHYSKQQAYGGETNIELNDDLTREKEALLENELRENFGPKIMYIVDKSPLAVTVTREKSDEVKAKTLENHANKIKEYVAVLGLSSTQPKVHKDLKYLTRMKEYLEKYAEIVRDHVSKVCDPEMYLCDSFAKLDQHFMLAESASDKLRMALQEYDADYAPSTPDHLTRLMDKMNEPLPIPRKSDEKGELKYALGKIEKFRTATSALYHYWNLNWGDRSSFSGCSNKCMDVALKCLIELESEYDSLVKDLEDTDENGKRIIQLEDAWNNVMTYVDNENDTSLAEDMDEQQPEAKRQKMEDSSKCHIMICSRVLLTPGRAIISSIIPVLKRKRAKLVRDTSSPHVILKFGKAFEMKIFFVPLLVTIRAIKDKEENSSSQQQMCTTIGGSLRWPSLHQGLHGSPTSSSDKPKELTVLGVTGPHTALANIAAKKLEYASSQATLVLRRCFAETIAGKGAVAKSDFEIEILEVGALVKFLLIARCTYIPDWVDDD